MVVFKKAAAAQFLAAISPPAFTFWPGCFFDFETDSVNFSVIAFSEIVCS